jgi:hypothetical protein
MPRRAAAVFVFVRPVLRPALLGPGRQARLLEGPALARQAVDGPEPAEGYFSSPFRKLEEGLCLAYSLREAFD